MPWPAFWRRDILRALGADFDSARHPVAQWMTRDPETVDPDVPVREALQRMLEGGFRHLPVAEAGRVVGMVSIRDLGRALAGDGPPP